ncbi:MAG TPA: hypothetical protein ENK57_09115 [Polyangiaceae bacterium]|nr:hypothetical protein [Polyangiaceae bacterium]
MDTWLEIVREDGSLERQPLEGERVTIGRSPSAGVPIPDARDLDPEHMMLSPRSDGCWVAVAQGASTEVRVRGELFNHGILAYGTEIEVAGLKLRITDRLPKEKKDPSDKKVSSPVLIAAFVLIPLVGWMLLSGPEVGLDTTPPASPPELFGDTIECPTTGSARHRADLDAEEGLAMSERYPFASQDGVQAVRRYERARACYRAAGATREAEIMRHESEAMQQRIDEDYRTHRMRLNRALEQERLPDALLETRALIELIRHREGNGYLTWLRQLSRQLQLVIDSAA